MRVLNFIRRNPVATFSVLVAGVLGWIGAELINPNFGSPRAVAPPRTIPLPNQMPLPVISEDGTPEERVRTLAVLPKLRPGMTRVEVEGILGTPPADAVQPVTVSDGRLRYRAAYELAEPDPPATVRPIRRPQLPTPHKAAQSVRVAVEFDASKPGHPLVEILYLDPLF